MIVIGLYLFPKSFWIMIAGLDFFISCPIVGSRETSQMSPLLISVIVPGRRVPTLQEFPGLFCPCFGMLL